MKVIKVHIDSVGVVLKMYHIFYRDGSPTGGLLLWHEEETVVLCSREQARYLPLKCAASQRVGWDGVEKLTMDNQSNFELWSRLGRANGPTQWKNCFWGSWESEPGGGRWSFY